MSDLGSGLQIIVGVNANDLQTSHLLKRLKIAHDGRFRVLLRYGALQQSGLKILEEGSLVGSQLGIDPILGIEENLDSGLPDAIILAPLAPFRNRVGAEG
jgi:hypothetical protein